MDSIDIDGIRKLAKLLKPLQEIADQAERINSIDQAVAEGEARLEAQRDHHSRAQAEADQRRKTAEEHMANLKGSAAIILSAAKAKAEEMVSDAKTEAERLVMDAGSTATKQLAEVAELVEKSRADADAQVERALNLATETDEAQAKLDAIRAAIAKLTAV